MPILAALGSTAALCLSLLYGYEAVLEHAIERAKPLLECIEIQTHWWMASVNCG